MKCGCMTQCLLWEGRTMGKLRCDILTMCKQILVCNTRWMAERCSSCNSSHQNGCHGILVSQILITFSWITDLFPSLQAFRRSSSWSIVEMSKSSYSLLPWLWTFHIQESNLPIWCLTMDLEGLQIACSMFDRQFGSSCLQVNDSYIFLQDLRPGAGPAPKIGSTVVVRLRCWALVQSNLSRRAKRISDILEEPEWFLFCSTSFPLRGLWPQG